MRAIAALALAAALLAIPPARAADADWEVFLQGFVEASGRVVDHGQGGISHSEGQGYAMLFAAHYGDRTAFERLWRWTERHLQVRDDALLAWRWEPQRGVTDRNNASDGDLLVAWALARAGERWMQAGYTAAARRIAQDVRQKLLRRTAHGLVLLPAMAGFEKPEGTTINLSYWVFPALPALARVDPAPEWDELAGAGLAILRYAYFGRWRLPPDWLRLGERVMPGGSAPERFGYDAVRIPVHLLWSGRDTEALLQPYRDFWGHFAAARDLPAFTNLRDDSVDSHGAAAGIRAIARMVAEPRLDAARLPALEPSQPYYSAVLLLLCKLALRERAAP